MRKNIQKVINAFIHEQSCHEKTCSTDGNKVYSYHMVIAERRRNGIYIVPASKAPSNTTRSQIYALQETFKNAYELKS